MSKTTKNNENNNERKYFDLHATGVGYVSRPREVQPKNGDSFLALDISALRGHSEQKVNTYTKFSTSVSGTEAKKVIMQHLDAMNEKDAKVVISFVISDIKPTSYTYKDKETGEDKTGCAIDGRLLKIKSLKINDKVVFKAVKNDSNEADTSTESVPTDEPVDKNTGEMAQEVTLDPKADDFNERKAQLKKQGYRWNNNKKVWSLEA